MKMKARNLSPKQRARLVWASRRWRLAGAEANLIDVGIELGLNPPKALLSHFQLMHEENDRIARLKGVNVKEKSHEEKS